MFDIALYASGYVVFVFSATLHEGTHAWAAKLRGDLTAYYGGQVSIDPVPHMARAPVGMVFMPLITLVWIGFPSGFAQTPYDPKRAGRHPTRNHGSAADVAHDQPDCDFLSIRGHFSAYFLRQPVPVLFLQKSFFVR